MKNSLFILLLVIIFSCSNKKEQAEEIKYHIQINGENIGSLADILQFQDFIQLETHPEAMINHINRIFITKNSEIITLDRFSKKISHFSKEGKFLNSIGKQGYGPSEFIEPKDIAFDIETNKVYVLDITSNILVFNANGEFIKKIKVNCHGSSIWYSNKSLLIHKAGHSPDEIKYSMLKVNMNGEIVDYFLPEISTKGEFNYVNSNNFSETEEGVKYIRAFDNTVYTFNGNQLKPFVTFDFGKHNAPHDFIENCKSQTEFREILSQVDYIHSLNKFFDLKDYLYLWLTYKNRSYSIYINKNSGQVSKYMDQNINDLFVFLIPYGTHGNSLINVFYPHFRKSSGANYKFREKYSKDKINNLLMERYTGLLSMELTENPVVILSKPKF